MEFLKRKHFSLWITLVVTCLLDVGYGLQGVPTWLCLGIKSPFIEFKNEIEILANTSISLNITKDEQVLMHEESLKKLGTFIKPIDLRNSTTGYVKSNLTKKLPPVPLGRRKGVTENPIVEEMDRKDIELLEDETDPNSGFPGLSNDDRKFIVPMALKNPTSEPKIEPKTPAPPSSSNDFSTNIDDLKNHILMLQNMTKNDKSFQSKFVVFPSIQRERNGTQIKSQTFTSTSSPVKRVRYTTPKIPEPAKSKVVDYDEHSEDYHKEISIIPQVLLLNDQTPPDEDDVQQVRDDNQKETRVMYSRRRNFRKTSTAAIMTAATTAATSVEKSRRNSRRPGGGGADASERRNRKRQQNCKNLDTPRCQRQRRRQLALSLNINKTMHMTSGDKPNPADPSKKTSSHPDLDQFWSGADVSHDEQKLSRSVRSHHNRRNAGGMRSGLTSIYEGSQASRDFIIPVGSVINNNQSSAYKEAIDLNPDLCYKVDGMTYGQQKLCVLHTGMMPAISRGARAAIQECQHQFRNRRWNCSTTEDNTVFGPVSSLGSPEMAFIHALAAATVTSFIARSCRDGQLPVCGCSRGARPKQLHDDWTWGGCGDDLEFAYKFAQDFIDIRERERKRGTRGLVSVPPKTKIEEKLLAETSSDGDGSTNSTSLSSVQDRLNNKTVSSAQSADENLSPFKPEDLLELQEKITKEILNSKLQEKEMLELQEKINREILNSKVFNLEHHAVIYGKKQHQRGGLGHSLGLPRMKNGVSAKSRSMMNIHNNEAGRRAVIKKTRITCKCHGVSGSCSLITCWQQLSSIREIGDYLREKYDAATQVKLNKRGRLQVRDPRYKIPTPHDLVYLDESPDWCRYNRQLQWPGTHGRVCNKTSSGLDGCAILCCGRGYNTKTVIVRERCNCKFHWCCQVKCDVCVKVLEEHTCK